MPKLAPNGTDLQTVNDVLPRGKVYTMYERNNMRIEDFMVSSGKLARLNYVLVADNEENISELKEMGCTDDEIASMRNEEDSFLDVYTVLNHKGYEFAPQKGFYRA